MAFTGFRCWLNKAWCLVLWLSSGMLSKNTWVWRLHIVNIGHCSSYFILCCVQEEAYPSNKNLHICTVYVHVGFCSEFVDTFKYASHIFQKKGFNAGLAIYLMKPSSPLLLFSKECRESRSKNTWNRVDFGERLRKLNIWHAYTDVVWCVKK